MKPLPMPIRLAAGLVATALEEAQELPRKLTELPVTAVSQALQVSMRVQQRVTDLAIKGDRALGSLRPVPETPEWARFDEDDEPRSGLGMANGSRLAEPSWASTPPRVTPVRILRDPDPDPEPDPEQPEHAEEVPAPRRSADPDPAAPARAAKTTGTTETEDKVAGGGPAGLTDYEQWSLPQLRGRFRRLSLPQLQALLVWETSHRDRPPYVTMLSNRIASVTEK